MTVNMADASFGKKTMTKRRPSRQGKKLVSGHFDPKLAKAAKTVSALQERSLESFLEEAIKDALRKYLTEDPVVRASLGDVIEEALEQSDEKSAHL